MSWTSVPVTRLELEAIAASGSNGVFQTLSGLKKRDSALVMLPTPGGVTGASAEPLPGASVPRPTGGPPEVTGAAGGAVAGVVAGASADKVSVVGASGEVGGPEDVVMEPGAGVRPGPVSVGRPRRPGRAVAFPRARAAV